MTEKCDCCHPPPTSSRPRTNTTNTCHHSTTPIQIKKLQDSVNEWKSRWNLLENHLQSEFDNEIRLRERIVELNRQLEEERREKQRVKEEYNKVKQEAERMRGEMKRVREQIEGKGDKNNMESTKLSDNFEEIAIASQETSLKMGCYRATQQKLEFFKMQRSFPAQSADPPVIIRLIESSEIQISQNPEQKSALTLPGLISGDNHKFGDYYSTPGHSMNPHSPQINHSPLTTNGKKPIRAKVIHRVVDRSKEPRQS